MLYNKFFQTPTSTDESEDVSISREESSSVEHEDADPTKQTEFDEEIEDGENVTIEGVATFEDHTLTLDVETNLIKGTTVSIHMNSFDDMRSTVIDPIFLHLQEETSFTESIDIPETHDRGFEVEIKFSPDYPEESTYADVYGDKGQKLTGPFVHMIEYYSDEDIYKEAKTSFYVLPEEDGTFETTFGEQDWDVPDDLGDKNIRLEAEARADDTYLYIEGTSNILEGAVLSFSILDEEEQYIDFGNYALTNPDGSFSLIYEYKDTFKEHEEKSALISFAPTDLSASWIIEQYGVEGEEMKGDLLKDQHAIIIVPIQE